MLPVKELEFRLHVKAYWMTVIRGEKSLHRTCIWQFAVVVFLQNQQI